MIMNTVTTFRAAVIFTTALALSGCASFTADDSTGGKFVVQYSTLKLIERSDDITSAKVTETVAKIRERVVNDEEIRYADLKTRLLEEVRFDSLEPSDQLLVMTIMDQLVLDIDTGVQADFISEEDRISIDRFLTWVEQAAAMAK